LKYKKRKELTRLRHFDPKISVFEILENTHRSSTFKDANVLIALLLFQKYTFKKYAFLLQNGYSAKVLPRASLKLSLSKNFSNIYFPKYHVKNL